MTIRFLIHFLKLRAFVSTWLTMNEISSLIIRRYGN